MPSESSQASSITETDGDEIVTSNQPVNAYVANMYTDGTDITAMYP